MRIVADENIDFMLIRKLRDIGFEVFSIGERQFGIDDEDVLSVANRQNTLLVTEDKGFGELVLRFQKLNRGVLLLRLSDNLSREIASERVLQVIQTYNETLLDCFCVLDDTKFRIKKLKK